MAIYRKCFARGILLRWIPGAPSEVPWLGCAAKANKIARYSPPFLNAFQMKISTAERTLEDERRLF